MSNSFDYVIDTGAFALTTDTSIEDYTIEFDKVFRKAFRIELLWAAVPKSLFQFTGEALNFEVKWSGQGGTSNWTDVTLTPGSYVNGDAVATMLQTRIRAVVNGLNSITVEFNPDNGRLRFLTGFQGGANQLEFRMIDRLRSILGLEGDEGLSDSTNSGTVTAKNVVDLTWPRYLKVILEFNSVRLFGVEFAPIVGQDSAQVNKASFLIPFAAYNFTEVTNFYRNTSWIQDGVDLRATPDFKQIRVRWAYPDGTYLKAGDFQGAGHQLCLRVHSSLNRH